MMGGQRRKGCCGRLREVCYLILTNLAVHQFTAHASLQDSLLIDQACLATAFQSLQANSSTCTIAGFNQTVLSCIGPSPSSDSYQALQLLVPDSLLASLRSSTEAFFNDSGWKAELIGYTGPDGNHSLAKLLASPANIMQAYDAWIVPPESLYDLFNDGLALNISTIYNISNDSEQPQLHWSDVDTFYQTSALNDGYLTGIPLFGDVAAVLYRTDYINSSSAYSLNTWLELLSTAAALNGTDFNNDGQPEYALCLPMANCRETGTLLGQILASTTQYKRTAQGWILNPANLNPLVGTPATMRALHILLELQKYSWPTAGQCGSYTAAFVSRKCAITVGGTQLFKQLQFNSNLRGGTIGYAPLPGSSMVLDRTTGYLVDCDPTLCPNAVWEVHPSGAQRKLSQAAGQWVNRAPLWAPGGWMGMINKNMPASNIWLAFTLLTTLSYSGSMSVVLSPTAPVGPARASHMPSTATTTAAWVAAGYDPTDVADFMAVMNSTWHYGNVAYGLRMSGQNAVMAVLQDVASSLLSGRQIGTADTALTAGINAIINNLPDKAQALDDYRVAINWHPPPADNTTAAMAGGKLNVAAISVVCAAGGTGLLLIIIVSVYTWERRRRWGIGGKGAPKASPLTTIVVTDIENSTTLWEFVEHEIMNQCIDLHHRLVRALLRKHTGYESATEGDSFILAFHTPASALAFAESFQLGLMNTAWPEELLENPLAEPIWMKATATTNFATGLVMPVTSNGAFTRDSLVQQSTIQPRQAPSLSAPQMMTIKTAPDSSSKQNSYSGIGSIEMQAVQPLTDWQDSRRSGSHTPPRRAETADSSRMKAAALVQPGKSFLSQITKASGIELEIKIDDQPLSGGGALQIIPTTPSAMPPPVPKAGTVLELIMAKWQLVTKAPKKKQDPNAKLAFKGLRVRIGIHTGIDNQEDAENDKTTGRTQYSGIPLMTAKAVGDSGHGGMILMTLDTFEKLPSEFLRSFGMILNMGDYHWPGTAVSPKTIYQVVIEGLEQRLAIIQPVLRASTALQRGSLLAPIGDATIVFVNMVGAATLRAWNREVADEAIAVYENLAVDLLLGTGSTRNSHPGRRDSQVSLRAALPNLTGDGGYLVELSHGLCLAAFTNPAAAILWALRVVQRMKVADWSDDILSHELCEQVTVAVQNSVAIRLPGLSPTDAVPEESVADPSSGGASSSKVPKLAQILFRGPRVKIGIDHGTVHANINPVTGRVAYRGRVMNRAARVGGKAGCGQVWCTHTTWQHAIRQAGTEMSEHVEFTHLGAFSLKGVSESLDLVQCIAKNSGNIMTDITSGTLIGSRAPSMQASEQLHSLQPEASSTQGIAPRSSLVVYSNPLLSANVHGSFGMHDASSDISFMHMEAHGSNLAGAVRVGADLSEQLQRQAGSFKEPCGGNHEASFDRHTDAFANPDPRYAYNAGESSGDMQNREHYPGRAGGHSRLSSHSSIVFSGYPSRDLAQFMHQTTDASPLAATTVMHTTDPDLRANYAAAMNAEVTNNRRRSLHVHGYQQRHLAAVARVQGDSDEVLFEDHGMAPHSPELPKSNGWRALQAFAGRALPLGVRKSARRKSSTTQIIEEERPVRTVSFVNSELKDEDPVDWSAVHG